MLPQHQKGAAAPRGIRSLATGKTGIIVTVLLLAVAGVYAWSHLAVSVPDARERNYICAETGRTFDYTLKPGEAYPVRSPYTNRLTGYPAEKCFWTRDGRAKLEPTLVLLNKFLGKEDEPTICPDCGRRVFPRNPTPPAELLREAYERRERGE